MASTATQLRELRQTLEKLQLEIAGRRSLQSMVVWDIQNLCYVNDEEPLIDPDFHGLVIHLSPDPQASGSGVSAAELEAIKERLRGWQEKTSQG